VLAGLNQAMQGDSPFLCGNLCLPCFWAALAIPAHAANTCSPFPMRTLLPVNRHACMTDANVERQ
jgi:hypothetical protein